MARIAFIAKLTLVEPLGIMRLGASLRRAGHRALLVDPEQPGAADRLRRFRPELLAFSAITGQHPYLLRISQALRDGLGVPVLWGGPHVSFFPQQVMAEGVDAVCIGEGDAVLVELAEALDAGAERIPELAGLWVKRPDGSVFEGALRPLVDDLDSLPWPDRELLHDASRLHRVSGRRHIIASRGCAYRCTYCYNHASMERYRGRGRWLAFRSVEDVLGEIQQLRSRWPTRYLYFLDDVLHLDRAWFEHFAQAYGREVRLPFCAHVRAELVDDDLARLLAGAGCRAVNLGIEAGDESVRRELLQRPMSDEVIAGACDRLQRAGIRVVTPNIIGLPGTTLEHDLRTLRLNQRCRPAHPSVSIYQPYPGTRLAETARALGQFDGGLDRVPGSFYDHSVLSLPHADKLRTLRLIFHLAVVLRLPEPAVRALLRLPPGAGLELVAMAGKALTYSRVFDHPRGPREIVEHGRSVLGSGVFGHWGSRRQRAPDLPALLRELAAREGGP